MSSQFVRLVAGAALAAGVAALPLAGAFAIDPQKRDDIHALLQLTDGLGIAKVVTAAVVPTVDNALRKSNPGVADAALDELKKDADDEIAKAMPDLEQALTDVYDKNFDADEIKQLVAFYQSPAGRKLVGLKGQLEQQGMVAARAWAYPLNQRIAKRMSEDAQRKGLKL